MQIISQKSIFLKSGQISIGPNKAYAGGYSGTVILLNNRDATTLGGKTYEQIVAAATPRPSSKTMTFNFPITDTLRGDPSSTVSSTYGGPRSPSGLTISAIELKTNQTNITTASSLETTTIPVSHETVIYHYQVPNTSGSYYEATLRWYCNSDYTTITLVVYGYRYHRYNYVPDEHKIIKCTLTGTIA